MVSSVWGTNPNFLKSSAREKSMLAQEGSFFNVCRDLYSERHDYYFRYYHDRPMIITSARVKEIRELHRILYKCIEFMAYHYTEFVDKFMPLSEREMEILAYQSKYPFKATTYRPDYLITPDGKLKLCEITSRFFAHGIFMDYYAEAYAERFLEKHPEVSRECKFEEMLRYMLQIVGDKKEIYVLKSSDRTSEIRLYQPFYEHFGKKVVILDAPDVEKNIDAWRNAFVISALNQKDILSFKMETIKAMIDAGMYNDFRTIFLAHDKRFMRLWFEDSFTDKFLTKEEAAFIRDHSIETFICREESAEAAMADAYDHKDKYILKHYCLGKSEKVYAGPLTDEAEWIKQFDDGSVNDMIMQPFLPQKTYSTVWEGTPFEDYICGMMLCVDDKFFDSGYIRASSCPVTNKVDDRKICVIASDDPSLLAFGDVL